MPQESCVIAKTRTDFIFALSKAIPIIIMITSINSNKNNIHLQRLQWSLLPKYFWKQLKYKNETILVKKGVAWRAE